MDEEQQDGRRRRVRNPQWTRQAIIDALLGAINEGQYSPTARGIAERAGVSERSVFTHFRDFDDLRTAAGQHQRDRIAAELAPIPAELPLADRLDRVLAQREAVFALMARVRVVALWQSPDAPALDVDDLLRGQLAEVFAPELAVSADAERLLDVLEIASGWSLRFPLQVQRRRDPADVTATARHAMLAALNVR
ncbi:TetR/AcrR family transcriptional regulator [Saccharopolyspora sp. NPDC047091]|uniref:TetR/AcrR family transcriptional regulator n=1 Tax=Saccharopolyspora sp. NPDC047091 TaxID=3155924 RepID=UPI0033C37643